MSYEIKNISTQDLWNSPLCSTLNNYFKTYWKEIGNPIEIECRIGSMKNNKFVPGVSQHFFQGMNRYLSSKNIWKDKHGTEYTPSEDDEVSMTYADDVRIILKKRNGNYQVYEASKKQKQESETFAINKEPYLLRVSVATENQVPLSLRKKYDESSIRITKGEQRDTDEKPVFYRLRKRTSYMYENLVRLDLTKTQSSVRYEDLSRSPIAYEVECEVMSAKESIPYMVREFLLFVFHRLYCIQPQSIKPPETSIYSESFKPKKIDPLSVILKLNGPMTLISSYGYNNQLQNYVNSDNILDKELVNQIVWMQVQKQPLKKGEPLSIPTKRKRVICLPGCIETDKENIECSYGQYEGEIDEQFITYDSLDSILLLSGSNNEKNDDNNNDDNDNDDNADDDDHSYTNKRKNTVDESYKNKHVKTVDTSFDDEF
ncbi:hypothetical protein WA158_005537 [Blastocystis sp. Blastoise]